MADVYKENISKFIVLIERGCSSEPSFIVRIRPGMEEEAARLIERNCEKAIIIKNIIVKCREPGIEILFTIKTGKLLIKASSETEAYATLERLLSS